MTSWQDMHVEVLGMVAWEDLAAFSWQKPQSSCGPSCLVTCCQWSKATGWAGPSAFEERFRAATAPAAINSIRNNTTQSHLFITVWAALPLPFAFARQSRARGPPGKIERTSRLSLKLCIPLRRPEPASPECAHNE